MSKKQYKPQASSSRVASSNAFAFGVAFGSPTFGSASSALSYLAEQPDLPTLHDANVVVSFKNLSKRDTATKTKALEDLLKYVISLKDNKADIEDGLLNAWIKVYPRASIDGDRRVKQLAHTTNGVLLSASGKKAAKHMPSCVGAWFAGCQDPDRSVSRAAIDAFTLVFPSIEKQHGISKVYQSPIVEFCRDAILHETPQTLSDERSTKEEDAQGKYSRLLSTSLTVLRSLLDKLPVPEVQKQIYLYKEVLTSAKIWTFVSSKDSSVRRALYLLLKTSLDKVPELIKPQSTAILEVFFSKNAIRRQAGSALDFVSALTDLSALGDIAWSNVTSKFSDLLKQGSQSASGAYWKTLGQLFAAVPLNVMPETSAEAIKILESARTGITRKEEPRSNAEDAWSCYVVILEHLLIRLPLDDQATLVSDEALPLLTQYLHPTSGNASWSLPVAQSAHIISKLLQLSAMAEASTTFWPSLAEQLINDICASAPEQSKEFQTSQNLVTKKGVRWFELEGKLATMQSSSTLIKDLTVATEHIIKASMDALKARGGKPFGAAAILESCSKYCLDLIFGSPSIKGLFDDFITGPLPTMAFSPSRRYLIAVLYSCRNSQCFEQAWKSLLTKILENQDHVEKILALNALLLDPSAPTDFRLALESSELQSFFSGLIEQASTGDTRLESLEAFIASPRPILSPQNVEMTLADLAARLNFGTTAPGAMIGLEMVADKKPEVFRDFLKSQSGSTMVQNVLLLSESSDESLAHRALDLNKKVSSTHMAGSSTAESPTEVLIAQGLAQTNTDSLAIETLIEFAKREISAHKDDAAAIGHRLLPKADQWARALVPILEQSIPRAMAISNNLGSAIFLIEASPPAAARHPPAAHDKDGYSAALRMAMFTLAFVGSSNLWESLGVDRQAAICQRLLLTSQLATDFLTIAGSNDIVSKYDSSTEHGLADFVSKSNQLLASWFSASTGEIVADSFPQAPKETESFLSLVHAQLLQVASGRSALAFRSARAFAWIVNEMIEIHDWHPSAGMNLGGNFSAIRKTSNIMSLIAYTKAFEAPFGTTSSYAKTCNELVATLTVARMCTTSDEVLTNLVLLTSMMIGKDHVARTIAKQRLIFFVKQIIEWLDIDSVPISIQIEVNRLLTFLLPFMSDVYGEHWSRAIAHIERVCNAPNSSRADFVFSSEIPLLHASLKLASRLSRLAHDQNSNGDLVEAWQGSVVSMSAAYLGLLEALSPFPDSQNQPLRTVNELLSRQIASLPTSALKNIEDIYQLVAVESQSIQKTAFTLLHGRIPSLQEQVSVDVALNKIAARLPDELLSLILEAPTLESLADTTFEREMPSQARGYLSGWLLIFDHFKNASEKVCVDYVTHLKENESLKPLLDFTFDFLGHSRGRPVDASKFDITIYSFDIQEEPVKDMQWLLIHLYYLALKRLPTLTKAWWNDCKSRQVIQNVESWTRKYISPSVLSEALSKVSTWASQQDTTSNDALTIKTNARVREVTLSKEIDEQHLSAVIRLPENYPLGLVVCESINRVAVDSKKWQTWLRNTQGVIAFSNMSLIDGIVAFRRNVNGTLKGHEDCAICYSIVGPEKDLPTKKCGTCKKCFHGACLYRWFKSSNSSSCPLCRNSFNYM